MCKQLLPNNLLKGQFHGLLGTTQAIANDEIEHMDPVETRRHLTPLSRIQRGLLEIILQSEGAVGKALQELNEVRLLHLVKE